MKKSTRRTGGESGTRGRKKGDVWQRDLPYQLQIHMPSLQTCNHNRKVTFYPVGREGVPVQITT